MYSIRSRARQLAWNREGGGQWNPFARSTSKSRVNSAISESDAEKGQAIGVSAGRTMPNRVGKDIGPSHYAEPNSQSPIDGSEPQIEFGRDPPSNSDSPTSDTLINPPSGMKNRGVRGTKDEQNGAVDVQRTTTRESKQKKHYTLWSQLRATVFGSWVNVLLVCVPVGIGLNYSTVNPIAVFVVNFLAIIPLAGLLSYSTEEISLRVGETLGGLLNASFGNAVELIVSIIALIKREITVVKTSLIGSMLSNLLLVMGMCFFFGGLRREEQFFNQTVAQTAASLLALAVGSLIIPTVFADWGSAGTPAQRAAKIPELSHGTAIILLLVYGCYLFFQLKTHASMYNKPSQKAPLRPSSKIEEGSISRGIATIGAGTAAQAGGSLLGGENNIFRASEEAGEEDEEDQMQLSVLGAIITLCVSTAFVGVCAEFMVDSIGALTVTGNISVEFVGLILIPIVGNAAEHATAVTVACKDKMDLAIGVAVGSSMQIALLVLPFTVVLGWIIDRPDMTLSFDGFLITLLFVSILLVNYLISDGRSHWLEGVLLMATYIIIAVAAWFYPASDDVVG